MKYIKLDQVLLDKFSEVQAKIESIYEILAEILDNSYESNTGKMYVLKTCDVGYYIKIKGNNNEILRVDYIYKIGNANPELKITQQYVDKKTGKYKQKVLLDFLEEHRPIIIARYEPGPWEDILKEEYNNLLASRSINKPEQKDGGLPSEKSL
jgi:hypothetical protein